MLDGRVGWKLLSYPTDVEAESYQIEKYLGQQRSEVMSWPTRIRWDRLQRIADDLEAAERARKKAEEKLSQR